MLAERLKLFATLTSDGKKSLGRRIASVRPLSALFGAAISVAALAVAAASASAAGQPCGAVQESLTKGLDAYANNRYELAIPMFDCVEHSDDKLRRLHAEFFLARIAADESGGFVDHARAYTLYQGIAEAADTVDPDDRLRAPFIAKAVTAIAGYVRRGLPEIGLKSDLERAVEYYRTSATVFNEPDAQFELAKMHLTGTGVPVDVALGLHYIQKLVQDGHAGAQAYLAEQHWTGALAQVAKDRARALAFIKLAVENASASDRLWIEDRYQNFYCGTHASERVRAGEMVTAWRKVLTRGLKPSQPTMQLGARQPTASLKCSNGEMVDMNLGAAPPATPMAAAPSAAPLASTLVDSGPQQTKPAGLRPPSR